MVIDIASLDLKDRPIMTLENLNETPIAILGNAFNLEAHIAYNETSSITFDLPAYANGERTPGYDDVIGTRLVRLHGWGVFILINPETVGDGIREIKSCKAYSREYELTYKKMSLEENTYNLWNPAVPESSILGIVLSYLPYWRIGDVDSDLVGKYRTFSESNVNIYNFLKNTVQTKYGCVVDFDTERRRIHVRSTANEAGRRAVFLSLSNLAKEIEREEDTENIFTCLDVNGADGVTIRGVNPTGTNKIYNLDYYMNTSHVPQELIDKWTAWKEAFELAQPEYRMLTMERIVKTSEIVFAQSEVDDTGNAGLKALEAQQSVYIEVLARSAPGTPAYAEANVKLNGGIWDGQKYEGVNNEIARRKAELETIRERIAVLEAEKDALTAELRRINRMLAFETFPSPGSTDDPDDPDFVAMFTESEILLLRQYFKEDSIQDSSFVYAEAKQYDGQDETAELMAISSFSVNDAENEVTTIGKSPGERTVVTSTGGFVQIGPLRASLIRATAEYIPATEHTVFTAYLSAGSFNGTSFPDGCLTAVTDGGTFSVVDDDRMSVISFAGGIGQMYFTRNTTEYEKYAVEWDLYEYGRQCLEKLAWPSYSFSVDAANFLSLEAFRDFKNQLKLGEKIYIDPGEGRILTPVFIGFEVDFEDPSSLKLEFSDKYCAKDSAFELADLLNQSVSMGKTVDVGRFGYNAFIDSGASTAVRDYMDAALDVAKQAILSSGDIAVSWDESGLKLRKWADRNHSAYDPEQIAMINNNIVFTDDGWQSAKMAIGHFVDANEGESWGIVAPSIVGTLLAGENLVIESKKQDGGTAVFKVDADGAVLHNSKFDIVRSNTVAPGAAETSTHILLDPDLGFGLGTYPVSDGNGHWNDGSEVSGSTLPDNAKFWVDMQGNVHIKGTLEGADGTFSGSLSAASGTFDGVVRASDFQRLDGGHYVSMLTDDDKFKSDYLELKGITVRDSNHNITFSVSQNGNVTVAGNITLDSNSSITWNQVNNVPPAVTDAYGVASGAAGDLVDLVTGQYSKDPPAGRTTFISGDCIYSPKIYADAFTTTARNVEGTSSTDSGKFILQRETTSGGETTTTEAFKIYYWNNLGWEAHLKAENFIVFDSYTRFLDDVWFESSQHTVRFGGAITLTAARTYGTLSQRPSNPQTGQLYFQLDS